MAWLSDVLAFEAFLFFTVFQLNILQSILHYSLFFAVLPGGAMRWEQEPEHIGARLVVSQTKLNSCFSKEQRVIYVVGTLKTMFCL